MWFTYRIEKYMRISTHSLVARSHKTIWEDRKNKKQFQKRLSTYKKYVG